MYILVYNWLLKSYTPNAIYQIPLNFNGEILTWKH